MKEPNWTTIERGEFALSCIVCDKSLRNDCGDATNQPAYGLAWFTHGHWPSPLFDSMGKGHLEISICDECMIAKASRQIAFVPPTKRDEIRQRMTVGDVRSMLARHDDEITFKRLEFSNGVMAASGLPVMSEDELEALLQGLEHDLEDDIGDEPCSS